MELMSVSNELKQLPQSEQSGILEEAARLVSGPRAKAYGKMLDGYDRAAVMFNAILGCPGENIVGARHIPLFMIAIKLSRLVASPEHRDSIVDIAGWAECYAQVLKEIETDGRCPCGKSGCCKETPEA
jgi:uncharacterized protein DUF6378